MMIQTNQSPGFQQQQQLIILTFNNLPVRDPCEVVFICSLSFNRAFSRKLIPFQHPGHGDQA
jgi:hypothetical protein